MSIQVLIGTAFVLSGAFLLAVYNSWKGIYLKKDKDGNQRVSSDLMLLVNMLGSGALMVLAGGFIPTLSPEFFKIPPWLESLNAIAPIWLIAFLVTGFLNIGIQSFNNTALSLEKTSLVTPLASATPISLLFLSWYILGQWPNIYGYVGIITISLGAYILYLKGEKMEMPKILGMVVPQKLHESVLYYGGPWIRIFSSRGARFALYSAFLGAISINFDALLTRELNPARGPGITMLFVGLATFLYMAYCGTLGKLKSKETPWLAILSIVVVYALSNILMATGYLFQLTPYAGSLKRTQIFWTVIIATMFLGEGFAKSRIIGAVVINLGTILISFG